MCCQGIVIAWISDRIPLKTKQAYGGLKLFIVLLYVGALGFFGWYHKNDEFFIKTDGFCITMMDFVLKMMNFGRFTLMCCGSSGSNYTTNDLDNFDWTNQVNHFRPNLMDDTPTIA